ncbi:MAG: HVO_2523 family zinc finger protein [Halobellus sp.]
MSDGTPDPEGAADDAEGAATATPPGRPCPLCDRSMARRHCKYVCPEHGVVYDCSDTFW